jgi:hypothetical protein
MRFVLPPQFHEHRHEAVAVAIACIGVGMWIGTWVIGPLVTRGDEARPAALSEPTSFDAMTARPDPFPYRTPTPEFDASGTPSYAAIAKEKAQAELGGQTADDDDWQEENRSHRQPSFRRYRVPDRFAPQ